MAESEGRPLLRPALRLLVEPTPQPAGGGGKGRHSTKLDRLDTQMRRLHGHVLRLFERRRVLPVHGAKTLLVARMFAEDSLAPSHTPTDLFTPDVGCRLIAPTGDGYLVETAVEQLPKLARRIESAANWSICSDISRVKTIGRFTRSQLLRGRSMENLWDRALDAGIGRYFLVWLRPYHDAEAREALLATFEKLAVQQVLLPASDTAALPEGRSVGPLADTSIGRGMREYRRARGVGRAVVRLPDRESLKRLIASGTVFRLDPVRPVRTASGRPARTSMPVPALPPTPVVAVVDGGLHDPAYRSLENWSVPPIVSDHDADQIHGNAVTSLVVHGHALNGHLDLPALGARVGTAQAVPDRTSNSAVLPDDLMDMLREMAARHRDVRVWNMSFNMAEADDEPDMMSDMGHQIARIARMAGALPVISIGNVSRGNVHLLPPADCEAALTVGGRTPTKAGRPGNPCPHCCAGPGPEGMLKPEVSWHSPMTVAGGKVMIGSSFPTAPVSVLAAHAFERLRDPTPDLVRALLINRTDLEKHDAKRGWGTPYDGTLPWECAPGSVTMLLRAGLELGFSYHWDGIPVPAEMVENGTFVGSAVLTAVLEPLVSPFGGANYFSTRIEAALQYLDARGEWKNLLGTMKESTLPEVSARNELKKWQPIRHHRRSSFRLAFGGRALRLRARLFARDLYQPGHPDRATLPAQEVAFVLTLRAGAEGSSAIYDSVVRDLGNYVESAVVTQDVTVRSGN